MSYRDLVAGLLALSACGSPDAARPEVYRHGPPAEGRAFRQGYTQSPPRGAPGFPPSVEPFLTAEEIERASFAEEHLSVDDRRDVQAVLRQAFRRFDLEGLRALALAEARGGRLPYRTAARLHRDHLFPSSEEEANTRYQGRFVVLTGRVAPKSMLDAADGFKVFEEEPYVHEPLLLETDFEFTFVRCHLAEPNMQPLRDWQEVHILGVVKGKQRSDVAIEECVVL